MIKLLAATAMLSGQTASPPAAPACLSRQQVGDVSLVGSSIIMDAVRDACRPHLAANAFLIQPAGADYLARLRAAADRRFDSIAPLIGILLGGKSWPPNQIRSRVQAMVTAGEAESGIAPFDAPFCREIDEIAEAMSPMSPDQYARFFTAFYSLMQQSEARFAAARAAAAAAEAEAAGDGAPPEPSMPSMPLMPAICPE